jgi:hypothetical protein
MTELKHLIGQAVAGKTRLQLTGLAIEGQRAGGRQGRHQGAARQRRG